MWQNRRLLLLQHEPVLALARIRSRMAYQTRMQSSVGKSRWKWFGIPWTLGLACLGMLQLIRTLRRERQLSIEGEQLTWQLGMFRLLPARPLSRAWGSLASLELSPWLRRPLLGLYVWLFGCQMEEAIVEDLASYQSLVQLFTRRLKHGARTVSNLHDLVSPSDGKVLHFGKINPDGKIEQVKGITYDMQKFLGAELQERTRDKLKLKHSNGNDKAIEEQRLSSRDGSFYHIVLYLAPGDYHHFHSPVDWNVAIRRHFPGELLTVAPWAAKSMPGLFALNERVILSGHWKYGFFTFAAVGAYNVGSINIQVDRVLQTNTKGQYKVGEFCERQLGGIYDGLGMKKGERIGHFNLGSSIVLIFEAPDNFEFAVTPGQTVKYGQPLGSVQRKDCPITDG